MNLKNYTVIQFSHCNPKEKIIGVYPTLLQAQYVCNYHNSRRKFPLNRWSAHFETQHTVRRPRKNALSPGECDNSVRPVF